MGRRVFGRMGPSSSERRRLGDVEDRSHSWRARRGSRLRRERLGGVPKSPGFIRQEGPFRRLVIYHSTSRKLEHQVMDHSINGPLTFAGPIVYARAGSRNR